MELVRDLAQLKEEVREDIPTTIPIERLSQGLMRWKCPANKFTVVRLHYSADPKKRSEKWKDSARSGLTFAQWMREYEIVFSSFEGIPVYMDDWSAAFHVSKEPLVWAPEYPVVRGWDFGLAKDGMACVWAQLLSNFRLFIYKELTSSDTDITHFAPEVKRKSLEWFPGCVEFFDVVDPSGFNRSQIDKRSCVDIIRKELGTRPSPGEKSQVKRRVSVVEFLQRTVRGLPALELDELGCPKLIEGFSGGYHFAYDNRGLLRDEPEKNEYSHVHDSLQMICSRIKNLDLQARGPIQMATPRYGFGN